MRKNKNPPLQRRSVLKAAGGSLVGTTLIGTASAQNGASHSGFVYHPVTHEILGSVSGQFNQVHDDLRGNLRLNVPSEILESLNLNRDRLNMNKATKQHQTTVQGLQKTKYAHTGSLSDSDTPRFIRLSSIGESIVGYIQHDGAKYAYSMVPRDKQRDSLESFLQQTGYPNKKVAGGEQ